MPDFHSNLPNVGDIVYYEPPNNQGNYFKCKIELIPEEKDAVVVRSLEESDEESINSSRLSILSYSYPGRFPKFYKEKPTTK